MKRFKFKPQRQVVTQQVQKPESKIIFMTHPQSDVDFTQERVDDSKKSWVGCIAQSMIDEWILKLEQGTGKKFTILLLFFIRCWENEEAIGISTPCFYVEIYDEVTNRRLLRDWSITCERQDYGHNPKYTTKEINGTMLEVRIKDQDIWNTKGASMFYSEGHVYLFDHHFWKDGSPINRATTKLIELLK